MNQSSDKPADDARLSALAAALGRALSARGGRLATAESCTGGWIAKTLTDIPGSSVWFAGGYVTYSNAAKIRDLGVPAAEIEEHGAVSEAVVRSMAAGAREALGTELAVAVSGVAGPAGGSADKPVGTVWIGFAKAGSTDAQQYFFAGDRESVRRASVARALEGLIGMLD